MKQKPFDRLMWGVLATHVSRNFDCCLLWNMGRPKVFRTREECRDYIRTEKPFYRLFSLRPVRVRESVEVCDESQ